MISESVPEIEVAGSLSIVHNLNGLMMKRDGIDRYRQYCLIRPGDLRVNPGVPRVKPPFELTTAENDVETAEGESPISAVIFTLALYRAIRNLYIAVILIYNSSYYLSIQFTTLSEADGFVQYRGLIDVDCGVRTRHYLHITQDEYG